MEQGKSLIDLYPPLPKIRLTAASKSLGFKRIWLHGEGSEPAAFLSLDLIFGFYPDITNAALVS